MATTSKQFAAPSVSGGTALTFRATVTDPANGNTSTDDVVVNVTTGATGVTYITTTKTFTAPTQPGGALLTFRAAVGGVSDTVNVAVGGSGGMITTTKTFVAPSTPDGVALRFQAVATNGVISSADVMDVNVAPGAFAADSISFMAPGTLTGSTLVFRATATAPSGATSTDDVTVTVMPATRYGASGTWLPAVRRTAKNGAWVRA